MPPIIFEAAARCGMSPSLLKEMIYYNKCEKLGWDRGLAESIRSKVRPDPITEEIEDEDIMRFIKLNPDDPDAHRLARLSAEGEWKHEQAKIKMPRDIDCSKFQMMPESLWVIKLDQSQTVHEIAKKLGVDAPQHNYYMVCDVDVSMSWDMEEYRVMEQYVTLPDSKIVERFIRMAIARPKPPFQTYRPNHLFLSSTLEKHKAALKPFLDSFAEPFQWLVMSPAHEQRIYEQKRNRGIKKYNRYIALATEKIEAGRRATAVKNQAAAVDGFMDAIYCLQKASFTSCEIDSTKNVLATCFGNCSFARLLDGDRRDAKKALEDATMALRLNECYAEGYIHLSRAYEALGIYSQAEESLARALRRPRLENDANLVDCLIALQTDRKGLPMDKEAFEDWSRRLFGNTDSSRRMKNVRGLWRKRCEDHRRAFASR
ncbi:hypothetical protein GALMADRAFT_242286 [Galerina marginata CBS 339.88]|uniref:Uncharacterized protein n=1 Tax=Galerina marginata (strain CBS 339.88) TaxID=685588 RepID=A0A067TAB0_GALM3|nr:hypothetical protein GALMADRAFT_242286 [Galerina marginata CBS 339.88]